MPLNEAKQPRTEFFDNARCKKQDIDPSVFYPEDDTGASAASAKAVCALCPVQQECLDYALDMEYDSPVNGIWGGRTEHERRKLLKNHPRPARYCARGHEQTPDVAYRLNGETRCRICVQETRLKQRMAAQYMREYRQRQRNAR